LTEVAAKYRGLDLDTARGAEMSVIVVGVRTWSASLARWARPLS
jgi:hypothetical protein